MLTYKSQNRIQHQALALWGWEFASTMPLFVGPPWQSEQHTTFLNNVHFPTINRQLAGTWACCIDMENKFSNKCDRYARMGQQYGDCLHVMTMYIAWSTKLHILTPKCLRGLIWAFIGNDYCIWATVFSFLANHIKDNPTQNWLILPMHCLSKLLCSLMLLNISVPICNLGTLGCKYIRCILIPHVLQG